MILLVDVSAAPLVLYVGLQLPGPTGTAHPLILNQRVRGDENLNLGKPKIEAGSRETARRQATALADFSC